jgi:hypothetical protein
VLVLVQVQVQVGELAKGLEMSIQRRQLELI